MRREQTSPISELLVEELQRIETDLLRVLDGLTSEERRHRPSGTGNPVGWLAWHIARSADEQIAALAGMDPVWTGEGWLAPFGLSLDPSDTGYGHSSEQVDAAAGADLE